MPTEIIFYDYMGEEIDRFLTEYLNLNNGDCIIHKGVEYQVRSRTYQTDDDYLYIKAYSTVK